MVFCNIKSYIQTWIANSFLLQNLGLEIPGEILSLFWMKEMMLQEKLSNKTLAMSKIVACQNSLRSSTPKPALSQPE